MGTQDMKKDDKNSNKNNQFDLLEDIASQELIIELLNAKKAEVFENVVFSGKRRYYIEDLTERDYSLENTTPYQIEILDTVIEESAWGNLLCKVSNLLLSTYPEYIDQITTFRCQWTKAVIFSTCIKTNYKPIDHNLYLNCNHTALHSCWLLQDLLDYFNIEKSTVHFLIHRPCSAEPSKVREYIAKRFKNGFIDFICFRYNKDKAYAERVVLNIDKYLNPMLIKISKSYTNFFLFDDVAILYNYVKKVRELIAQRFNAEKKAKLVLNKYLDYLVEYYKV